MFVPIGVYMKQKYAVKNLKCLALSVLEGFDNDEEVVHDCS